MRQDLRALAAEHYPVIATELLSPLLRLLMLCRKHCQGDVDKFLVLLVVAVRTTQHKDFARYTPEQLISGELPVFPSLGTNCRSIADSLGMPKESARRKVAELVAAGWLARQGNRLHFTAKAYLALAPVRVQIETLAVLNHETIARLREGLEHAPGSAG